MNLRCLRAHRLGVTLKLLFAVVFSGPLLVAENAAKEGWQTYIDDTYKLTLRFPGEWTRVSLALRRADAGS